MAWISRDWKEYEVLDATEGFRLESWAGKLLVRPDPQVIWATERADPRWDRFDAKYHRSSTGGGRWELPHQEGCRLPHLVKLQGNWQAVAVFPLKDTGRRAVPDPIFVGFGCGIAHHPAGWSGLCSAGRRCGVWIGGLVRISSAGWDVRRYFWLCSGV